MAATVKALFKGGPAAHELEGGWREEGDRLLYRHEGRRGGEIRIAFAAGDAPLPLAEQWRLLHRVGPLTSDVLMILLARAGRSVTSGSERRRFMHPVRQAFPVTARDILRFKGFSRWGRERADLVQRIAEEMTLISSLTVEIAGFPSLDPSSGRWSSRGITAAPHRLFEILPRGAQDRPHPDMAWDVRLGIWAQYWLNEDTHLWLSPLPMDLVALDHRSNRGPALLAKKVGINIFILWGAVRSQPSLDRRLHSLLESIGELPMAHHRHAHWAGRIRDRLEEAMALLQERAVLTEVEWLDFEDGFQRSRGWASVWLDSKVRFARPGCLETPARSAAGRKPAAQARKGAPRSDDQRALAGPVTVAT